jgi:hypothetical protein
VVELPRRLPDAPRVTPTRMGIEPVAVAEFSGSNLDDRLPRASLGRVEGGDGIIECRDVANVGPQSSVPHPLHDLTQLGTIGLDDKVNR